MKKVVVLAFCLAGCGGSNKPTITLGALLTQSGALAAIGQEELRAAQVAIDEINAGGGVLGSDLTAVNADDGSDSTRAPAAAMSLITGSHVDAILGGVASGSTIAASGVTIPADVVLISGSSTSPAITSLADNDTVFRTCASDALQGELLAKRAVAKGFKSVAVIWIPNPYGQGLSKQFVDSFTQAGGTVPFNQMYTEGQQSYASLLTQAYAATPAPEAILLIAYAVDGAQMIKDYNSAFAGKQTFWFFTDGLEDPSFVASVGPSNFTFQHEGTGPTTPDTPAYASYAAAFMAKYNVKADPGTFSPNIYDATYLLALAMQAGGASDADTIKAHIRDVAGPPGMKFGPGQWAEALAALKSGQDVDYDGASSAVDLDQNGEPVAPYDIWKVSSGSIMIVEPAVMP